MQDRSLAQLLLNAARQWPDRDALIFPNRQLRDNRRTYREFLDGAMEKARALIAMGIKAGDRVGIFMPDCIDFVECIYAISLIGARTVPINIRYRTTELAYVIDNADIKLLLTSAIAEDYLDVTSLLKSTFTELGKSSPGSAIALEKVPRLKSIVVLHGKTSAGFTGHDDFYHHERISDDQVHQQRCLMAEEDRALIIYTSGTTANPKGCILNEGMLTQNSMAMAEQRYYLTEDDRFFDALPMFHMASILPMLAVIQTGGAFVSMMYFEEGEALRMLEEEKITVAFLTFPPITAAIINHPDFGKRDLSLIRRINNVAPPDTLAQFQNAFPQAVQTAAFGMTEAGGVISFNRPEDDLESRLNTCGQPFDGIEIKIINPENGTELEQGEPGEILIRGYCLFDGYYRNPEATAAAVDPEGWFHSGDICSLDEQGRIRYHGRTKDMLKVGGENVSALEIESFLSRHPAVKLVQVVARDDPRLLEVPVAFVELKQGANCSEAELIDFCQGQIASFKIPHQVRFVSEWPMSATKVQKFRLRKLVNED